jgi:hypothetical protein
MSTSTNLPTMSCCSDQFRFKSCSGRESCEYQTAGSHISNWFFVGELTRTVDAETANRWVRHQTVHPSRLKRCLSVNPKKVKESPMPNVIVSPTLSSTSFHGYEQSIREMTATKDEAADMSFPQQLQPKTLGSIHLLCFRDTSSLLLSQSRNPRGPCGAASASISVFCDCHLLPADRKARMGLLFTDAAHTVLD